MSNPVTAWFAHVASGVRDSVAAVADRVRLNQRTMIDARKAPSGKPQKANTPATAKAKQKRLGHDIPLKDQGILSDPDRYRTTIEDGGYTVTIHPPDERQAIIPHLRNKNYEVMEMPADAQKWMDEELKKRVPK
jgi:hypothetical protein